MTVVCVRKIIYRTVIIIKYFKKYVSVPVIPLTVVIEACKQSAREHVRSGIYWMLNYFPFYPSQPTQLILSLGTDLSTFFISESSAHPEGDRQQISQVNYNVQNNSNLTYFGTGISSAPDTMVRLVRLS
jgi:hypothetical protein